MHALFLSTFSYLYYVSVLTSSMYCRIKGSTSFYRTRPHPLLLVHLPLRYLNVVNVSTLPFNSICKCFSLEFANVFCLFVFSACAPGTKRKGGTEAIYPPNLENLPLCSAETAVQCIFAGQPSGP